MSYMAPKFGHCYCRPENMHKKGNFGNNNARKKNLSSLDDGDDGEYNSVSLMEISNIFVTQGDFLWNSTI